MKVRLDKDGYKVIKLHNNKSKQQYLRVHRLIAITFIPNINNHPVINHKDGNIKNNTISNLEWCTISENVRHAIDIGLIDILRGEQLSKKWNNNDILEIHELTQNKTLSVKEICKKFNMSPSQVKRIKLKQTWKHLWE